MFISYVLKVNLGFSLFLCNSPAHILHLLAEDLQTKSLKDIMIFAIPGKEQLFVIAPLVARNLSLKLYMNFD